MDLGFLCYSDLLIHFSPDIFDEVVCGTDKAPIVAPSITSARQKLPPPRPLPIAGFYVYLAIADPGYQILQLGGCHTSSLSHLQYYDTHLYGHLLPANIQEACFNPRSCR
jgi:hypothetical protein